MNGRDVTRRADRGGALVVLLAVVGTFPSGGDRLMIELIRRWPTTEGPVTVLTTPEGLRNLRESGVEAPTIVISGFGTSSRSVLWAYFIRSLIAPVVAWSVLRRTRPRTVVASTPFPPDVAASLASRVLGYDWVLSWQLAIPSLGMGYEMSGDALALRRLRTPGKLADTLRHGLSYVSQNATLVMARWLCKQLIVPSHLMALEAYSRGFERRRVHIANVGVDGGEISRALAVELIDGKVRFEGIFVGRFHAQKGLMDLVAAWSHVLKMIPDARLAILGDGTSGAATEFKRHLKAFGGSSIEYLGAITGGRKYALMSSSKVLLFPSHHESWGLVALEAMAVGLPVVGYDLPSSREAFGDAMLRVPTFDVKAFADAVVRLLTDDKLRALYRTRGRDLANQHDWSEIARRFAEVVVG